MRQQLEHLFYLKATATPANPTGSDQAQSPSHETAAAPAMQPAKKPKTSSDVFLSRSLGPSTRGSLCDSVSNSDRTVLVKLPVITAVEGAPGTARRKSANWQAIAETAVMAVMPAVNPCGFAAGCHRTLKIRTPASSRN